MKEINERLQAAQDYLGDRNCVDKTKIRFPTGYIRPCIYHTNKYSFLDDKILQSNIAYATMTTDVFRWMFNRTNISLTAKEMLIKQGIVIFAAIVEAVVKHILIGKPGGGNRTSFNTRIRTLVSTGKITEEVKNELEWLWELRNHIHLILLDSKEYKKYKMKDYNRALMALKDLRISLGGLE